MSAPNRSALGKRAALLGLSATLAASLCLTALPAQAAEQPPIAQPAAATATAEALPTAQINGVAWTQLVVGDKVYVGGNFTSARPAGSPLGQNEVPRTHLLAYNINTGELDPSFAPVLNNQVKALAASPDGSRLYVGGNFTTADGFSKYRLAAYNTATGQLIKNFSAGVDYTVNAIVATNDVVYLAGAFGVRLAAFSASTGALLDWRPTVNNTVMDMVMTDDQSKLVISGSFNLVNGTTQIGMAALDLTTGATLPWAANTVIKNSGADAAILTLSTKGDSVYGGGYTYGTNGNLEGVFSADAATGAINWIEDCHGDTYGVYAGSAAVYQVGHAHYCGNLNGWPQPADWTFNRASAFTTDAKGVLTHNQTGGKYANFAGTPAPALLSWNPLLDIGTFTGKSQAAWTAEGDDRYLVLGGEFPKVNGVAQQGLARFALRPAATRAPEVKGALFKPTLSSSAPGAVRISFLSNGDRDDRDLTYSIVRDGMSGSPIYTTIASSSQWDRPALGFIDNGLTAGQTYNYRLRVTDPSGNVVWGDGAAVTASSSATGVSSTYGAEVLSQGADLYWPLNDPSTARILDRAAFNDAVAGAGVVAGAAGAIAGDSAMTFSGTSTGDLAAAGSRLAPDTFSVSAWFKTNTIRGGRIVGFSDLQQDESSIHADRQIHMNNTGKVSFGVWGTAASLITSPLAYNDNAWHFAAATFGADGMSLMIDGKRVASRSDVTDAEQYVGYWRVGGDSYGGFSQTGSSAYFAGSIDEVAVYPNVLTLAQVNAQLIASGRAASAPTDPYGATVFYDEPTFYWRLGESTGTAAADSGMYGNAGGYQGTSTKGVSGAVAGTSNAAVTFNGTNAYVTSNSSFTGPATYSVEAWVKTTTTKGGRIIGFGSSKTGTSTTADRQVYMRDNGTLVFASGSTAKAITPTAYNDGQWHHVVGVQDGSGLTLYVDGVARGTAAGTPLTMTGYWRVAGDRTNNSTSNYLAGTVDEAAVYPRALVETTVQKHFQAGGGLLPNVLPTAAFTVTVDKLAIAVDADLSTDSDGTIQEYLWSFGDGATGSGKTATHSYAQAGPHQVTLTVRDDRNGTGAKSQLVEAIANVAPSAAFTSNVDFLHAEFDAAGSADSDGTISAYSWDFGDGHTGTGAQVTHDYATAGAHTVVLTVTDDDGASTSTSSSVTTETSPNGAPTASFTADAHYLTVAFDGSDSSDGDGTIEAFEWSFGDGAHSDEPVASHTYAEAGEFEVTLKVTDDQGAVNSTTQTVTVADNVAPTASFTATTAGHALSVDATQSTDPDGDIVSYEWTFGDGSTESGPTASHVFGQLGTFTVTLTVTDDRGLTHTASKEVVLTPEVFAADSFDRTVTNGWGQAEAGGPWTVGSGGTGIALASVTPGVGALPVGKGATRVAALSAVAQRDVDLRLRLSADKVPVGGSTLISGSVRRTSSGEYRATVTLSPTAGKVNLELVRIVGGVGTTLRAPFTVSGVTFAQGTDLNLRLLVTGTTTVTVSAKLWPAGGTEPSAWTATGVDAAPTAALQSPGAVAVVAYVSGNATNAPVTILVKNFSLMAAE